MSETFKFYQRTSTTFGGYGWAINSSVFDVFLNQFDYNQSCFGVALDAFGHFPFIYNKVKGINVIPSLIIPKVDYESSHTPF